MSSVKMGMTFDELAQVKNRMEYKKCGFKNASIDTAHRQIFWVAEEAHSPKLTSTLSANIQNVHL